MDLSSPLITPLFFQRVEQKAGEGDKKGGAKAVGGGAKEEGTGAAGGGKEEKGGGGKEAEGEGGGGEVAIILEVRREKEPLLLQQANEFDNGCEDLASSVPGMSGRLNLRGRAEDPGGKHPLRQERLNGIAGQLGSLGYYTFY